MNTELRRLDVSGDEDRAAAIGEPVRPEPSKTEAELKAERRARDAGPPSRRLRSRGPQGGQAAADAPSSAALALPAAPTAELEAATNCQAGLNFKGVMRPRGPTAKAERSRREDATERPTVEVRVPPKSRSGVLVTGTTAKPKGKGAKHFARCAGPCGRSVMMGSGWCLRAPGACVRRP